MNSLLPNEDPALLLQKQKHERFFTETRKKKPLPATDPRWLSFRDALRAKRQVVLADYDCGL